MSKILRYLACLAMLMFVGNALAAYDNCSIQYTSCKSGYYMNGTGAGNSCNSCTGVSASDLSQSCTRSCSISNGTCSYSGSTQKCTGNHTGGAGGTSGSGSCTGCSAWGSCSGGTRSVSCNSGYYLSGSQASGSCNSCSSVSANGDVLSSTTITGGKRQQVCTGNHTGGAGGTSGSGSCSGCSSSTYQCVCNSGYHASGSGSSCTCVPDCSTSKACSSLGSGWQGTYNECTGNQGTQCYKTHDCTGDVVDGSRPSGCSSGYSDGSCGSGYSGTYREYYGGSTTSCSASTCYEGYYCSSASGGYYASGGSVSKCPGSYPSSDSGSTSINSCYTTGTCYGSVVDGSRPSGCSSGRSDGSCGSGNSGTRRVYYNGSYGSCSASTCYEGYTCTSASSGYYLDGGTARDCGSTYPYSSGGNIDYSYCYKNDTCYGSVVDGSRPSGCSSGRSDGSCGSGNSGTRKHYSDGTYGSCSASTCYEGYTCTSASDDYYLSNGSPVSCPSSYPYSDGGNIDSTYCYTWREKTGSQQNPALPSGCASYSLGSCTPGTCDYKYYSDGTSGSCTATSCTKPINSVTADDDHYVNGKTCPSCPSGYPNSDGGSGGVTQCYSNSKSRAWTGSQIACSLPSGCSSKTCNSCSKGACNYVAYSNSTGTGDGTIKSGCSSNNESCNQTVASVKASAGHRVSGTSCPACAVGTFQGSNDSTATSCSVCAANTYASSTGMSACTSCPSGYVTSGTAAANHDAKSDCTISCQAGQRVTQADAQCSTPSGSWYTAAHTVAAGSTTPSSTVKACLTNYATPNTSTRTDHDASNDCEISCVAGTRIASANATSCTTPAGNWYVGPHSVAQGSTSSVSNCLTNYTISGTAASNHDAANDCKISCGGGSYIAQANATSCSAVGAGYWAAASTISQGSAGVRNQCDAGLTTIGSGAGADEEDDCGRVLNFNGEKIYLRSGKKTTPSLNVGINGTTFYGNLGTGSIGSLRIKSGDTTYSVYDDSMQ